MCFSIITAPLAIAAIAADEPIVWSEKPTWYPNSLICSIAPNFVSFKSVG